MAQTRTRTIRLREDATLLHVVGHGGVRPANPPDQRSWELGKIETVGDRLKFTYYRRRGR